jgi:hypothetical protein
MSDDLVQRLRSPTGYGQYGTCLEAADRIEALERALRTARNFAKGITQANNLLIDTIDSTLGEGRWKP